VKGRFTKIIGAFLFVVLLAGIIPKEYKHHAIFDHHDDVHPLYKKGEMVITKQHNHCSFLSFEFAPFVLPGVSIIKFKEQAVYAGYVLPHFFSFYTSSFLVVALRGPPAAYFSNSQPA
jgi:hypothetical protein